MEDIKKDISNIIENTIVETFHEMFGQDVEMQNIGRSSSPGQEQFVCTGVSLGQRGLKTDFTFNFDQNLLLLASSTIFPKDIPDAVSVMEDLACEITNIVCSKVKAYLNAKGYDIEMDIPFIEKGKSKADLGGNVTTHLYFSYNGEDVQSRVGVTVDFMVLNQAYKETFV